MINAFVILRPTFFVIYYLQIGYLLYRQNWEIVFENVSNSKQECLRTLNVV